MIFWFSKFIWCRLTKTGLVRTEVCARRCDHWWALWWRWCCSTSGCWPPPPTSSSGTRAACSSPLAPSSPTSAANSSSHRCPTRGQSFWGKIIILSIEYEERWWRVKWKLRLIRNNNFMASRILMLIRHAQFAVYTVTPWLHQPGRHVALSHSTKHRCLFLKHQCPSFTTVCSFFSICLSMLFLIKNQNAVR